MDQITTIQLLGGGPGSGCNPDAARAKGNKCGRSKGHGHELLDEKELLSIEKWTSPSYNEQMREMLQAYFDTGKLLKDSEYDEVIDDVKHILSALKKQPPVKQMLYRGMSLSSDSEVKRLFPLGSKVAFAASFSEEVSISKEFSDMQSKLPSTPVRVHITLHAHPNHKSALSVGDLTEDGVKYKEWIVAGKFSVYNIYKQSDGSWSVELKASPARKGKV